MTGAEVIEEIKRLPSAERAKVLAFTRLVTDNPPLTPEELGELANRMVETEDSAEADRLKEKIVRGFYGGNSHAQDPAPRATGTFVAPSGGEDTGTPHLA